MSDVNPYAPPTVDDSAPAAPRKRKKRGKGDIAAALEALEEHLSDPGNVARDARAAGGKLRTVTLVLLALGVLALVFGALVPGDSRNVAGIIGAVLGVVLLLIGGIAAAVDLSLQSRREPGTPIGTLKSHVKSIVLARYGYTWATLSPTARARSVSAPDLAPAASGVGTFPMESESGVKLYASTFARPGGGKMRSMQLKKVSLVSEDGDVAVVEAAMTFQSWPQWANILLGMGGVFGARIGQRNMAPLAFIGLAAAVIGLIGIFALRKTREVMVRRTLIRGKNGAWYLLDADILEGASGSDE